MAKRAGGQKSNARKKKVNDTVGMEQYFESNWSCAFVAVLISLCFKWAVGLGPYSGKGKQPMFGDYEAQRHWMEITYNLPISQWYFNSSQNDLLYWGLDYPPLTAYHSYILGYASHQLNASWVDLLQSRGHESYEHQLFMRYSVLVSDVLFYTPAVVLFVCNLQRTQSPITKLSFLFTHLLYPGLLLVDYGHFQYNCVSLGLWLYAVCGICANQDLLASVLFVCALNYKQMELYHAMPFFCYLLGSCLSAPLARGFAKLIKLGAVVICSFCIIWLPFLHQMDMILQVLHRIFPFARGIYEDKVANVWCSLSIAIKLKQHFSLPQLVRISGISCLLMLLPTSLLLLFKPTKRQFKLSLVISSLVFFLFSFQVHEKSILLVAIPILLLIHQETLVCVHFLLMSVISLCPLCVKDGLELSFFALFCFYYVWLTDIFGFYALWRRTKAGTELRWELLFVHLSVLAGLSICVAALFVQPPKPYPDLFAVVNSVYCCAHFCLFLMYFMYRQFVDFGFIWKKLKKV